MDPHQFIEKETSDEWKKRQYRVIHPHMVMDDGRNLIKWDYITTDCDRKRRCGHYVSYGRYSHTAGGVTRYHHFPRSLAAATSTSKHKSQCLSDARVAPARRGSHLDRPADGRATGRKEPGLTSLGIISPSHTTGYQLVNAQTQSDVVNYHLEIAVDT